MLAVSSVPRYALWPTVWMDGWMDGQAGRRTSSMLARLVHDERGYRSGAMALRGYMSHKGRKIRVMCYRL